MCCILSALPLPYCGVCRRRASCAASHGSHFALVYGWRHRNCVSVQAAGRGLPQKLRFTGGRDDEKPRCGGRDSLIGYIWHPWRFIGELSSRMGDRLQKNQIVCMLHMDVKILACVFLDSTFCVLYLDMSFERYLIQG